MKNEIFYLCLLIVAIGLAYFRAYKKGVSIKKWLTGVEYVFCGVTYTGYLVLAEYYGPKRKNGKQKIFFDNGVYPGDLKMGHVYSFELSGTSEKVYRVMAIELTQDAFASLAGLNNPVIVDKSEIL